MSQLIWSLISGLAIATVSAVVTVNLALRRFYREKWWEHKFVAYSRIVDALFQMKLYAQEHVDAYDGQREISEERDEELYAHWRAGRHEISRAAAIGTFVISAEASACIESMLAELDSASEEEHYYVRLHDRLYVVKTCLEKMRELARKDLAAERQWFTWPRRSRRMVQGSVVPAAGVRGQKVTAA